MSVQISKLSTEYVRSTVTATVAGNQVYNPTADLVQMAFVTIGVDPAAGDWKNGVWETITVASTGAKQYVAKCLVGPAGVVALVVGRYDVWVKISDNPEAVVKYLGQLEVV